MNCCVEAGRVDVTPSVPVSSVCVNNEALCYIHGDIKT